MAAATCLPRALFFLITSLLTLHHRSHNVRWKIAYRCHDKTSPRPHPPELLPSRHPLVSAYMFRTNIQGQVRSDSRGRKEGRRGAVTGSILWQSDPRGAVGEDGRDGGGADHKIQACIWWRDDGWLNRNDRTSHVHTATWLGWVPRQDELLRMCVGRAGTSTLFILKDEKWLRFPCNSHDPNMREQLNPSPVPSHMQVTCCSFGQSPVRRQTCSARSNWSLSAVNQLPFQLV